MNTQIPKIIGAARRYELTGDPRYRRIAEFFWTQVTQHRATPPAAPATTNTGARIPTNWPASSSYSTQECCCTYNMLKLTRHLFTWSPEARYFDYYERALFNGIMGTMNPKNGMTMYYVPLATGYWKVFASPRGSFWCCTGTGVESFSKLADSIYFHDEKSLYVNLFLASELDWEEKGIRLRQECGFPRRRRQRACNRDRQARATGRAHPRALLDGRKDDPDGEWKAGGGSARRRVFGDRSQWAKRATNCALTLPMNLHVHPMPDDDTLQAIMYGPLVLAGDLGREGLTDAMRRGGDNPPECRQACRGAGIRGRFATIPARGSNRFPSRRLTFRTKGQSRDITMLPLNRIIDQRYGVYWRVTPKEA